MKTKITRAIYNGVRLAGDYTKRVAVLALEQAATLHIKTMFNHANKQYDKADDLFHQSEVLRAASNLTRQQADAVEFLAYAAYHAACQDALEMGVDADRLG